ncbi:hypothetical protein L3X38_039500 [Prunus dulcis]|uniref:Uncharacterized protein n=1 Tax=Prunus dulcis TaxID=3755 RepID=A0AAD4YRI6_PRUDU|nr:hypothetical protein L3X38_039500 [Prunus dulcis]
MDDEENQAPQPENQASPERENTSRLILQGLADGNITVLTCGGGIWVYYCLQREEENPKLGTRNEWWDTQQVGAGLCRVFCQSGIQQGNMCKIMMMAAIVQVYHDIML